MGNNNAQQEEQYVAVSRWVVAAVEGALKTVLSVIEGRLIEDWELDQLLEILRMKTKEPSKVAYDNTVSADADEDQCKAF